MGLTEFAFSLFIFPILIFIAVFIFERAFGTRLIRLGCTCWEQVPWRESRESRIAASSSVAPEPSNVASTYQSTKKEALEKIESMLENFSMVLQKEDMVQRLPNISSGEEDEYDNMVDIELGNTDSHSNHDEQQDDTNSIDNNTEETNSTTDNIAELFRFTHIMIPHAGQKIEEDTNDNDNNPNRREVPHFCAICLGQYELDDTVSWASSSQCTHCFHRDCVTQWWIASWKKKRRTVLHTLEEKATINCPMCRQPFMCWLEESCGPISKEKVSSTDEDAQRRIDEELADY